MVSEVVLGLMTNIVWYQYISIFLDKHLYPLITWAHSGAMSYDGNNRPPARLQSATPRLK